MEKDPVSGVRCTFILLVSGSERTEGMENLGTSEELAVCEESSFPNRKTSKAQSKCLGPWETMISSANLTTECTLKTPAEGSCREQKV